MVPLLKFFSFKELDKWENALGVFFLKYLCFNYSMNV